MHIEIGRDCGRVGVELRVTTAEDAKPNDAQIAHIAYTAGQIDIQAAELALQKSKNKDVRDFAENMVRDHKAVNDQALALVKKLNVTPQDNDTSKALVKQATVTEAELKRSAAQRSTRPTPTTRSPTTRRSTGRSKPSSFLMPAIPN